MSGARARELEHTSDDMVRRPTGPAPYRAWAAGGGRSELWRWSVRGFGLALGVLSAVLLALLVQASVDVLVLVLVSVLLAAALDPLVETLRARLPLSRVKVIALIYVSLVLVAVGAALLLVPTTVAQLSSVSSQLPSLINEAEEWVSSLEPAIVGTTLTRLLQTLEQSFIRSGVTGADPEVVVQAGLTAADAALAVMTVLTLVFFWLISREAMQRFALSMLPHDERRSVRTAWNEIQQRLGYWLRGQLAVMAAVGLMTTVAYLLLGLENALLLGLFAGIAEIIPIVGPAIGAVPALIAAFVAGGPELALVVAGVYVVIQVLEGQLLVPMIMRNAVGLPPFVVIVALLIGAAVSGLVGALLAVPVAAAVAVVLERAQARKSPVALDVPSMGDGDAPDDPPADDRSADADPARVAAEVAAPMLGPIIERR